MFTSQSPWRHLYLQWCEQQLLLLSLVWIYLYRSTANLEQQHTLKKWNKSSNSDLKCIVHEHKEVITGCQVIELSLLSQTRTYKPAWWSAFSLFFIFWYCQNNYVGILMWQEEKQHMIWTVHGETNISLLRLGPYCSLPALVFRKRFIRPPISLQSHDTSHTADHRLQSCFSPRTHYPPQSWLCTNSHSWHLNITDI